MTFRTLIRRSLRFHWRAHLGVVLGAAVGSAALIGALVVGDSVRESLRERALERLGPYAFALASSDRFFTQQLADEMRLNAALLLPATIARQDGLARANQVNVIGVQSNSWNPATPLALPRGSVLLNQALAAQLSVRSGDEILLRIHKPSALSRDVPITPQSDANVAFRLKVHGVVPASDLGNFSLRSSQTLPLNAFLNRDDLAETAGLKGKANVIVASGFSIPSLSFMDMSHLDILLLRLRSWLPESWFNTSTPDGIAKEGTARIMKFAVLEDFGVSTRVITNFHSVELITERIFLEATVASVAISPPTNQWSASGYGRGRLEITATVWNSEMALRRLLTTNAHPILTYLVNQLRAGERMVPYSMITAAGAPWTPPDLRDDQIIINEWLADDLQLKPGDPLDLVYFLAESGAQLVERTNRFRVRAIVPLSGIYDDRTLMPEFPGVSKAESTHDWEAGFPLTHKIRDQDEKYWKEHRGTPKAFITLAAGQSMWGNRFGNLTAIRYPLPSGVDPDAFRTKVERSLLLNIDPAALGLRFEPVREQALKAANEAQDFGQLFIGFSFFLILAALILMALLFQFGLEQRVTEIGTLLALGFEPKQVRRLFLLEGTALAFIGGVIGVLGGLGYARAMLYGLTTLWRSAVGTSALAFHVTGQTLVIGLVSAVIVSAVTIWLVLRKQARQSARELLAGELAQNSKSRVQNFGLWVALVCGAGALSLVGWALAAGETANAGIFFGAGALGLIAGLGIVAWLLTERVTATSVSLPTISLGSLAVRGCKRRRKRSLATAALLACGSFLIVAVGANKLDANLHAERRSSGTGGFALIGESTLPVVKDLNTKEGLEFFGLEAKALTNVSFVPFRVRNGDDASCLNLNRAQTPRLLGVKPELLQTREAFTFAGKMKNTDSASGWDQLKLKTQNSKLGTNEVPAIGDAASIEWALHKKLGDTLDFTDEHGQPFKVRLVAGLANSVLQGSLIIDEEEFLKKFPGESGYRMFLVDAPSNRVSEISATLSRAMQDVGLELTPAARRLAQFNAVQNTYLNTFQVLGGLGLLLGSAGLGVVVLRNVLERRGELAVLTAVGFERRRLQRLVLGEHAVLLWLGLGVGIVAALIAVLPALVSPTAEFPVKSLAWTLSGVLVNGLLWTWVATRAALRGRLVESLRSE